MESFRQYIDTTTEQDHGGATNFHLPFDGVATVHPCSSCGSGFKKHSPFFINHPIPPPPDSLPLPPLPLLHRWNSDQIPIIPSPENAKIHKPISMPAPAPPPPTTTSLPLKRSVSDLTQAYLQCSPAASTGGRRRSSLTCPDLNKLREMKKQMKDMLKMCDKVMSFSQEQEDEGEKEQAVTVERQEGSNDVSFKCQCGKNYQILLIGDKCYYKI